MHLKVKWEKIIIKDRLIHFNQKILFLVFLFWVKILFWAEIINHKTHREVDRPVVIIANHMSGWDPFLIFSALRRKHVFLGGSAYRLPAYYSFFKNPIYRAFFKAFGVYSIQPKGNLKDSLAETLQHIREGHNMVFFPQGKRVPINEKAEAKKGIGYLAKCASFYILPVYLEYDQHGEEGFEIKFGAKAKIVFGDLIESEYYADNYTDEDRHYAIMDTVWSLKKIEEFKRALDTTRTSLQLRKNMITQIPRTISLGNTNILPSKSMLDLQGFKIPVIKGNSTISIT